MPIKNHDFIEIEYTGKLKEEGIVFDTTSAEAAKQNNAFEPKHDYKPIVICIGEGQIIMGIDSSLIGKEAGKEYTFDIKPENAFGKKNPALIQLITRGKFRQHNINPVPGLQVNIDGIFGTIKNVSGGRILVDFNHPLSGKEVAYTVKVNRIITDTTEKISGFIKTSLNIDDVKVEVKEGIAVIDSKQEIPEGYKEEIAKKLKEILEEVKEVEFGKVDDKEKIDKTEKTTEEEKKVKNSLSTS